MNMTTFDSTSRVRKHRIIKNANIILEDDVIHSGAIAFHEDGIEAIGRFEDMDTEGAEIIDAAGGWVMPGFIDIHVHGGGGHDFMESSREAFDGITRFHASHGTTGMLATSVTAPKEAIDKMLAALAEYRTGGSAYAQLLGAHLEGPFISPSYPGAQNPNYIVPPRTDWVEEWTARFPGVVKMISFAPETEGALELASQLAAKGIVAAAAHTNATYDQVEKAVARGLSHAVHTFNAMKGLHHREPGVVGAVLSEDRITAEVIADGHHVHPAGIKLLAKAKPDDRLVLITDAISAAGLPDGPYSLGGLAVTVKDGVARLTGTDTLAGSTLNMMQAYRFAVEVIGLDMPRASRLASLNPAKRLGLDAATGSLIPGKQADIVLASADLQVRKVWVQGREVGA
ncbi:N-acetylglucosamine-6-phosphate deacetylase [Gorillibacterium massiliense]|uniref:N-acetylglucosamine-6-phosphate deacetylase n=1 Tax=Gorillibacterium massiliense TaxID=1280390 RepID=UPI0004B7E3DD|nr:N-acetylglucosamine-6-phosphate deacetylase [Gorillibacterium massiliense]